MSISITGCEVEPDLRFLSFDGTGLCADLEPNPEGGGASTQPIIDETWLDLGVADPPSG